MGIDVTAERVLPLPWTQGIRTAEPTRQADVGGFGVGAEVTRTAFFLTCTFGPAPGLRDLERRLTTG